MEKAKSRILILDDDPMILKLLSTQLRLPGVHLVLCSEIEAAESLLNHDSFQLLVTDLKVSALGGLEGMNLIRYTAAYFPETEIVIFSGFLDDNVRRLASSHPESHNLLKTGS